MLQVRLPAGALLSAAIQVLCCTSVLGKYSTRTFEKPSTNPGGAKVSMQDKVVTPLLPMLSRKVENLLMNYTFPEQKFKQLTLGEVRFRNVTVGSTVFELRSPNRVGLRFLNMTALIPSTNFTYRSFWCHLMPCSGNTEIEMQNVNATLLLSMTAEPDGVLDVAVGTLKVRMGDPKITVAVKGRSSVRSWLDSKIKALFRQYVVPRFGELVRVHVNSVLRNQTKRLSKLFPIAFVGNPVAGKTQITVALVVFPDNLERTVSAEKIIMPRHTLPGWPIGAVLSYTALNNVLRFIVESGYSVIRIPFPLKAVVPEEPIYRQLDSLCQRCSGQATFEFKMAPWLKHISKTLFYLYFQDVEVTLSLLPKGGAPVTFVTMTLNARARVRYVALSKNILSAKLDSADVNADVKSSLVSGLDSDVLSARLQQLVNGMLIPLVNLKKDGFNFPYNVSGVRVNVTNGAMKVGINSAFAPQLLSKIINPLQ